MTVIGHGIRYVDSRVGPLTKGEHASAVCDVCRVEGRKPPKLNPILGLTQKLNCCPAHGEEPEIPDAKPSLYPTPQSTVIFSHPRILIRRLVHQAQQHAASLMGSFREHGAKAYASRCKP